MCLLTPTGALLQDGERFRSHRSSALAWRGRGRGALSRGLGLLIAVAMGGCSDRGDTGGGAALASSPDEQDVEDTDTTPSIGEDGCRGLTDCGWACREDRARGCGVDNAVSVLACDHCPRRADDQVCEAGTCRDLHLNPGGLIQVLPTIPEDLEAIQAAIVATVLPTMADGSRATCERLLAGGTLQDIGLNIVNVRVLPVAVDPLAVPSLSLLTEPGPDRLVVVLFVDDEDGSGEVLAKGCREQIEVVAGGKTTVGMDCARTH
ncbi:MAG: hypothetical protein IPK13_18355 [Deltaproteobacteria bacterium]|nr:hypothetical protein [Deltaproteobacteria bacterium]